MEIEDELDSRDLNNPIFRRPMQVLLYLGRYSMFSQLLLAFTAPQAFSGPLELGSSWRDSGCSGTSEWSSVCRNRRWDSAAWKIYFAKSISQSSDCWIRTRPYTWCSGKTVRLTNASADFFMLYVLDSDYWTLDMASAAPSRPGFSDFHSSSSLSRLNGIWQNVVVCLMDTEGESFFKQVWNGWQDRTLSAKLIWTQDNNFI